MATPTPDVIVFAPKSARPPPPNTVGVVGWLRENLFYSWTSTIATAIGAYVLYVLFAGFVEWALIDAVWEAKNRRECLTKNQDGACWAGVIHWFNAFMYGRYPDVEQWRINTAGVILVAWLAPLWIPQVQGKISFGATAVLLFPFLAGHMFYGGERGWFMNIMVFMALGTFIFNCLHAAMCVVTGRSLRELVVEVTGFANKHEGTHKWPLVGTVALIALALYLVMGDTVLLEVKTNLWGGLFLTVLIAGVAITSALPGGILLALARRSNMPFIRVASIAFIEVFRSVPLITVLFMAVTMMPLFVPEGVVLNKLVQVIIGVCLFASAYMAEVVRGGLQAIPNGQYDAGKSMGLNYWQSMNLIILPQALKLMIPNIVGNFIGLLKDTTLVSIIGLYDMLLMIKAASVNPTWNGLHTEPLVMGATIYFLLCFAMSRYSQHLERTLNTDRR